MFLREYENENFHLYITSNDIKQLAVLYQKTT